MPGCLEVPTRDNLQSLTNVDNESPRTVRCVVPLLIFAPDLQTRDGNREEQCSKTKVSVAVHSDVLGLLECLFVDWSEQRMAEVALSRGRAVRLDIVPKPVVW